MIVEIVLLLVIGVLASVSGLQGNQAGVLYLGFSLCIIGLALLARRLGAPDRAAFTAAGIALIVLWLLPSSVTDKLLPDMNAGIEMFFLSGIMLVIAAVWVVVFNSDLLVRATVAVLGRFRSLPPILKTAVAYPMQNRFRTGMTLAMFSLVVFTLVCMSFIIAGIGGIYGDTEKLAGGFDVRASTSYANPVVDLQTAVSEAVGRRPDRPGGRTPGGHHVGGHRDGSDGGSAGRAGHRRARAPAGPGHRRRLRGDHHLRFRPHGP